MNNNAAFWRASVVKRTPVLYGVQSAMMRQSARNMSTMSLPLIRETLALSTTNQLLLPSSSSNTTMGLDMFVHNVTRNSNVVQAETFDLLRSVTQEIMRTYGPEITCVVEREISKTFHSTTKPNYMIESATVVNISPVMDQQQKSIIQEAADLGVNVYSGLCNFVTGLVTQLKEQFAFIAASPSKNNNDEQSVLPTNSHRENFIREITMKAVVLLSCYVVVQVVLKQFGAEAAYYCEQTVSRLFAQTSVNTTEE